ncbi:hypothetical protein H4R34_006357 [Dimargaris verticillata]|uniref:Uncharacterized protein n=1 Tax=Dimargaris verticillata TaxID=2761393 RepID=A0A9W8E4P5_9FUNG|nr:hypothetical protein H4R34_006357 [Dimargaris verticillata]
MDARGLKRLLDTQDGSAQKKRCSESSTLKAAWEQKLELFAISVAVLLERTKQQGAKAVYLFSSPQHHTAVHVKYDSKPDLEFMPYQGCTNESPMDLALHPYALQVLDHMAFFLKHPDTSRAFTRKIANYRPDWVLLFQFYNMDEVYLEFFSRKYIDQLAAAEESLGTLPSIFELPPGQ